MLFRNADPLYQPGQPNHHGQCLSNEVKFRNRTRDEECGPKKQTRTVSTLPARCSLCTHLFLCPSSRTTRNRTPPYSWSCSWFRQHGLPLSVDHILVVLSPARENPTITSVRKRYSVRNRPCRLTSAAVDCSPRQRGTSVVSSYNTSYEQIDNTRTSA